MSIYWVQTIENLAGDLTFGGGPFDFCGGGGWWKICEKKFLQSLYSKKKRWPVGKKRSCTNQFFQPPRPPLKSQTVYPQHTNCDAYNIVYDPALSETGTLYNPKS